FKQQFGSAAEPTSPIFSALVESGYNPGFVNADSLSGIRVLVAAHAERITPAQGQQLVSFVQGGGLLITTPWLAEVSGHRNIRSVYPDPSTGLDTLLGSKLLNTSQTLNETTFTVPPDPRLGTTGTLTLKSKGRDQVQNLASDVAVLAKYADGVPAILSRAVGAGRVIYLNVVYDWDGWWFATYEPGREALRQLLDQIIRSQSTVSQEYRIG